MPSIIGIVPASSSSGERAGEGRAAPWMSCGSGRRDTVFVTTDKGLGTEEGSAHNASCASRSKFCGENEVSRGRFSAVDLSIMKLGLVAESGVSSSKSVPFSSKSVVLPGVGARLCLLLLVATVRYGGGGFL